MDYIFLKARAKINIALDVLNKRHDDYHNIKTVMQTLQLHDSLVIKKDFKSNNITLKCNLKWLSLYDKNLVYKAAKYMKDKYNIKSGIVIDLKKNIPISAGMGGGSSDCAAALIGIRNLYKLPISTQKLQKIGENFGADVPYCIMRGTVLAQGIGQKLKPLGEHPNTLVLVVKPPINVSTSSIFKNLDLTKINNKPNIDLLIQHIQNKNLKEISNNFCNVLESVTIPMYPIIEDIKNIMIENNAYNALMTGSGPSVFGYFSNIHDIKKAIYMIKLKNQNITEIFITSIFNPTRKSNNAIN